MQYVDFNPKVELTDAGKLFIESREKVHEIFTRQLLKFQLSSPYHTDKNNKLSIKPYLKLLRLVFELEGLSKDEIAMFVMQLTNVKKYRTVKNKIIDFQEKD